MPSALIIKKRYEVKSVLGRGGMGVVYHAFDSLMKRDVAVKTLREVPDGILVELFYRECSVLAGMVHPNVVEIFDMGEFDDNEGIAKPYFVMPLLPGQTLHDLLYAPGAYPAGTPLSPNRCVDVMSQACRGLQAAHDRDLLHRDIKPRNIFVMKDDAVKLIDFGVAHLMGNNSTGVRGTPQYMSPEQITFKPLQRQSDIFSLATVCYEALTASHPFLRNPEARDSAAEIATAITSYTPPLASDLNPAVSRALAQVVAKAMAKDPWNRFDSAAAFADALQKALRNEASAVRVNTAGVQIRLERARRSLDQQDFQFASEIISELESEGHSDPQIQRIRFELDEAIRKDRTDRLLEAASRYFENDEYSLALRKVQEVLQLEPANQTALELRKKIEEVLTEQKISELLKTAAECIERLAFTGARQAIQDALKLRPHDQRARVLLNEIDLKQKELLRHRQEQERLFQAAHTAWLSGQIKLALANLEELTRLTQKVQDPDDRVSEYREFHERVRSEQEAIDQALEQGRRLLASDDFTGVQRICERYLRKYPEHEDFLALGRDVGRRREEEAAAYRAGVQSRLQAEPDLEVQATILDQAINARPNDEYFRAELAQVRERQKEVAALVNKARSLEIQQSFTEAIREWERLAGVYPQYPQLEEQLARVREAREKERAQARAGWVARIGKALDSGDHESALRLLGEAEKAFPRSSELNELAGRAQAQAQRSSRVNALLAQARAAAAKGEFQLPERALSEAAELGRDLPVLTEAISAAVLEVAAKAAETNWRAAKSILERGSEFNGAVPVPSALRDLILRKERDEQIANLLADAAGEESAGRLENARELMEEGLRLYPDDSRLNSFRLRIEAVISERQRRAQRETDLRALKSLQIELASVQTEEELHGLVSRAQTLANRYPHDAEFAPVIKEIINQATAYDVATGALGRDDLKQCLGICEEILRNNPEHRLFSGLKVQAEIRDKQKAVEFLDSVERHLAAEPDLAKRAQILERALREYPEEGFYQEELRLVRGKQALVEAIAQRAKALEANGWYPEALERWQYLKTVHPFYAGLDEALFRCAGLVQERRERARQQHLSAIRSSLAVNDATGALALIEKAQAEFAEDPELRDLEEAALRKRELNLKADALLKQGVEQLEAQQFEEGQRLLVAAAQSDPEHMQRRQFAAGHLLRFAAEAVKTDFERAESMVAEARSIDPASRPSEELLRGIEQARRRRDFGDCVEAVSALESAGEYERAIHELDSFLARHPGYPDAEALRRRMVQAFEEEKSRQQKLKDIAELRELEDQATRMFQPSGLLNLREQAETIALRNRQDEDLTVAANQLSGMISALAEIRRLLSQDQLEQAEVVCQANLKRYPRFSAFSDLHSDIAFRKQQEAAEYLRDLQEQIAREPDFRKHVPILERARAAYPAESFYSEELKATLDRLAILDAKIAHARELEGHGSYEEAVRDWVAIKADYPWLSHSAAEIARLQQLEEKKKEEIVRSWVARVKSALSKGERQQATDLLKSALTEAPGEPRLLELERELGELQRRSLEAGELLVKGRELLAQAHLREALVAFDSLLRLTPEDASVRAVIVSELLRKAREEAGSRWLEAEELVRRARQYQPKCEIPVDLLQTIERRKRETEIEDLLKRADGEIARENWVAARLLLEPAAKAYQGEQQIQQRLDRVNTATKQAEAAKAKAQALVELAAIRSQLNATTKKRPLQRLQTKLESSSLLSFPDPEVREGAEGLRTQFEERIRALQAPPKQVAPKPEVAGPATTRTGRNLKRIGLVAGVLLAATATTFLLMRGPREKPVELALTPDHVTVLVGGKTCVTPDCNIRLRPGTYPVQLSKDGFIGASIPLTITEQDTTVHMAAELKPVPPPARPLPPPPVLTPVVKNPEPPVVAPEPPEPAIVEMRGAPAGTLLRIDGSTRLLAGTRGARLEVAPGVHVFELARQGFATRRFQRKLEPGETVILEGSVFALTPENVDTEPQDWARVSTSGGLAQWRDFLQKHPNSPHAPAAEKQIQQLEWEAVDKRSSGALGAYLTSHSLSPHAPEAKQLLDSLQRVERERKEKADWDGTDKSSRKGLEEYVAKYPDGRYSSEANRTLADMRKAEEISRAEQAETNAWNTLNHKDPQALQDFISRFPSGKYRSQAGQELANLMRPVLKEPVQRENVPDDAPGVLAAVQRLAAAWNAKDVQAIVEAQPSLNRRAIKTQLDSIRNLHVTITPVSVPQVSGNHATVTCRRVFDETFADGTQKMPESVVTYSLARSGSGWVIESAR